MCFFGQKKYVPAISCLKRALYLEPFEWLISYNLGLAYLHTQQYASAFHYLSSSITIKGDSATSYMYLGLALSRLDDLDNAIIAYQKALTMDPTDPLFPLNFCITLAKHGRLEQAAMQFQTFQV
jgi:Bardet-Biedl syndrome 4 protein